MMASGKKARSMATEFGREFSRTATLENGETARQKDTGYICGRTGTNTKGSG